MEKYFLELGLKATLPYLPQFEKLLELYQEWNSKINLSSIKDEQEIILKHFCDSLLLLKLDPFQGKNLQIADIGTGGGFPLLPLAITNPEQNFIGIDSVGKKLKVIDEISHQLNLKNITTLHNRAEEIGQDPQHREKYDIVLTRAFAKWNTLLEMTLPLLKTGGILYAYQGPQITEEIESSEKVLKLLGGRLEGISFFTLSEETGERVILKVYKEHSTPQKYPRENGIPKKNPLGINT